MDSELSDSVLLRAEIEVNLHQLEHLQRSQREIQAALIESPNDEDFKQALDENKVIISSKINKLQILKRQLEAVDVSFQREQRFLDRLNSAMTLSESSSISAQVTNVTNHTIPEEGIYL